MAMGRPKATLVLDSELREQLESLANSRSLPSGLVRRAKIILLSASGKNDREIAPQLETSRNTVGLWRRRFLTQGMSGLYEELRPGRPRPISDERVAQLVRKTLLQATSSFFPLRFRHSILSVLIWVLLDGNEDPLRPGDERFKKLSNGVKRPLPLGPCHHTRDRQYRSHANRRARSAMSYIGLSLPNRIPNQNCKNGELWTSFWH